MLSSSLKSTRPLVSHLLKGLVSAQSTVRMSSTQKYETLSVSVPKEYVYHVELNRPQNLNAMNRSMWIEIGKCFENLDRDDACRVVVLSGAGKLFTAGLDFMDAMNLSQELADKEDVARRAYALRNVIKSYQNSLTWLERCRKPVLAAVHSACVGGGINLIAAADIRYCTKDAWFQVKEVDIGMAADVGILQRLPKIVGSDSLARELCYTARKLPAAEALSCGFVSQVFEDKDSMIREAIGVAEVISKKSPVAVQGTKISLVYSRDHTVQDGLDQIADWNQTMLQSDDFANAVTGQVTKQKDVVFSKL